MIAGPEIIYYNFKLPVDRFTTDCRIENVGTVLICASLRISYCTRKMLLSVNNKKYKKMYIFLIIVAFVWNILNK